MINFRININKEYQKLGEVLSDRRENGRDRKMQEMKEMNLNMRNLAERARMCVLISASTKRVVVIDAYPLLLSTVLNSLRKTNLKDFAHKHECKINYCMPKDSLCPKSKP